MPGPVKEPKALKILKGSFRPDRDNANEPVPAPYEPTNLPEHLAAGVRQIWNETTNELRLMGTLHRCDRDALLAFCHAVENHRQASYLIAQTGIIMAGADGKAIRNPALSIQRDSADLIRKFAQEFGLTPSARSRIRMEEAQNDADSPFSGQQRSS